MLLERVLWIVAVILAAVGGYYTHRKRAAMSFAEASYSLKVALENMILISGQPLRLEVNHEVFITVLQGEEHVLEFFLTRETKTGAKVVMMRVYDEKGHPGGPGVYGLHEYGIGNILSQANFVLQRLAKKAAPE